MTVTASTAVRRGGRASIDGHFVEHAEHPVELLDRGFAIQHAAGAHVCLFIFMCMQPLFGALSDRIGRRRSMLLFGALGSIATVPILTTLQHVRSPLAAGALIVLALAIVSFYTSVSAIVKSELFPAEVRAMGVGLAYAIANAIFGGSAEYVALGLKSLGNESCSTGTSQG